MDINAISMAALSVRNSSCSQILLDGIYNAASKGLRECTFTNDRLYSYYADEGIGFEQWECLEDRDIQYLRNRGFVVTVITEEHTYVSFNSVKVEW